MSLVIQLSSLGDLVNQRLGSWLLVEKIVTYFGNHLIYVFSCMCLYCCCSICLLCSQVAAKWATSMQVKSDLIVEEGECMWHCKSWSWGVGCWKRLSKGLLVDTWAGFYLGISEGFEPVLPLQGVLEQPYWPLIALLGQKVGSGSLESFRIGKILHLDKIWSCLHSQRGSRWFGEIQLKKKEIKLVLQGFAGQSFSENYSISCSGLSKPAL